MRIGSRFIILFVFATAFILAVSLTGCTIEKEETPPTANVISTLPFDQLMLNQTEEENGSVIPTRKVEHNVSLVIYGVEGDLIDLNPVVEDPDGDDIALEFTPPFDENGLWQTGEGDAGEKIVIITASDGKDQSQTRVLVSIAPGNKAPVIECPEEVTVKEGDTISLDCNIYDVDGDSVIVTYSGFMKSPVKRTTYDDAGEYTTVVQASDKQKITTVKVNILVENKNRAPVLGEVKDVEAVEDDIIMIKPEVEDLDKDRISLEFSEPLDKETGVWKTKDGDAGTYDAYVKATDGESTAVQRFKITVYNKNTAPRLDEIPPITVYEGELIKIPVNAYDPEGDSIIVTYAGWMDSAEYQTTYDDAGNYTVVVGVSDGVLSTSQVVKITVLDKNRPPVFIRPG